MQITISLSDRSKTRKFEIDHAADCDTAIEKMMGKRFLHATLKSWADNGSLRTYDVMARTGPTRKDGATPFCNITANVYIE